MFTTLVKNFCSQNVFTTPVQNFCFNLFITTFVQKFSYNFFNSGLLTTFAHNSCLLLLFTTFAHSFCSKQMFKTSGKTSCSQLLFTTFVHNFCLKFVWNTFFITTSFHKFCTQFWYTTFVSNFCSQLLFIVPIHNSYWTIFFTTLVQMNDIQLRWVSLSPTASSNPLTCETLFSKLQLSFEAQSSIVRSLSMILAIGYLVASKICPKLGTAQPHLARFFFHGFRGSPPVMEDHFWWKAASDWRHHLMEEYLWWRINVHGRWFLFSLA